MSKTSEAVYDDRYREGYRTRRSGYEIARASALEHFIGHVARVNQARRVLDYGAGSGLHVDLWEKIFSGAQLHFTDISGVALEQLAARYPRYSGQLGKIEAGRAPFADRSFEVVVSVEVLEHVDHLDDYLKDIWRLLTPGGTFIWTTPCGNRGSIEHLYSRLTGQVQPTAEGYRRWSWEDPTHLRRMRTEELTPRLKTVGFSEPTYRLRSHIFSFVCSRTPLSRLPQVAVPLMRLDYNLLRRLPNGASMLGAAKKLGGC